MSEGVSLREALKLGPTCPADVAAGVGCHQGTDATAVRVPVIPTETSSTAPVIPTEASLRVKRRDLDCSGPKASDDPSLAVLFIAQAGSPPAAIVSDS